MKKIIILFFALAQIIFAQAMQDTSNVKKINVGFELSTSLLPKVKNANPYSITHNIKESKQDIGLGISSFVNFNFNRNLTLSIGIAVLKGTDQYTVERPFYNLAYDKYSEQFLLFNLPLLIQISSNRKNRISYFSKTGLSFDYKAPYKERTVVFYDDTLSAVYNTNLSMFPKKYAKNYFNISIPIIIGISYAYKSKADFLLSFSYIAHAHLITYNYFYTERQYFKFNLGFLF